MSRILLKQYSPELGDAWDSFVVNKSRNGGIFHEQKFLGYHAPGKFQDCSLVFYEDEDLVGVLPAVALEEEGRRRLVSHAGSTNGGLVYSRDCNLQRVLEMLDLSLLHYQQLGFDSVEMKIAEPIFHPLPDGELNFLLWHRGFHLKTQELSSCVFLDKESGWEKMGRKKNLTDIRKLEREGFRVVETNDTARVHGLITKNLAERYNKKPTHSLEELQKLKELYGDRIQYWTVVKDEELAAAIVLFEVQPLAVHDFYIAQNGDFSNYNILPLLFYKVFSIYRERGVQWFNFGISTRADTIKWGILEFKERMGGRATNRQVWLLDNLQEYKPYIKET